MAGRDKQHGGGRGGAATPGQPPAPPAKTGPGATPRGAAGATRKIRFPMPARPQLDLGKVRRYRLAARRHLVAHTALGRPLRRGLSLHRFLDGLPDILAVRELRAATLAIAAARRAGRGVVLGMGAHPIKVGLSPLIIDLMEQGVLTALALNGACIVHDFELAFAGATSEDVGAGLADGSFGMAEETGRFLNDAISNVARAGLGLGEGLGRVFSSARLRHRKLSLLAAGARLEVPVSVHVALGTDIIHMHPEADGAAIGAASLRDFHGLAATVAALDRGVFLNLGSAVVIPEVFVKALNLARNLGHRVGNLTTINMDFIRHYRPAVNVLGRPTEDGGRAIQLTGHHEIMLPLLFAGVLEELGG
jgi:hypothetical protein